MKTAWLHLDEAEIEYETEPVIRTVVYDVEENKPRFAISGKQSRKLIIDIIQVANRAFVNGKMVGRNEKNEEIKKALGL
jgi:hypothetical protein